MVLVGVFGSWNLFVGVRLCAKITVEQILLELVCGCVIVWICGDKFGSIKKWMQVYPMLTAGILCRNAMS